MRALIFGAGGLLGQPLARELERRGIERLGLDHAAADIADRARVTDAVRSFRPDVIFNCAAYTKVDDCEEHPALALQVYGQSKVEGERQALEWERSIVVRTSWLFGAGAPSFVATVVRLLTRPA